MDKEALAHPGRFGAFGGFLPASTPALRLRFPQDGTPEHRDLAAAALLDFENAAVHERGDGEWLVCFRTREQREHATAVLRAYAATDPVDVEDEDWARKSQQDLKAIAVGQLVIAPPWDSQRPEDRGQGPEAPGQGPLIVIEPSTGFGTGHHATTRLCLLALQQLDLRGRRVLDVGTGSGVLAIAAAKLGASKVTAVDNDPDAIAAASENVRRNGVDVDLRVMDFERSRPGGADVVLANLTGAMLRRAADTLAALARQGVLIVSGLLDEESAAVEAAFSIHASSTRRESESGWSSLTLAIR